MSKSSIGSSLLSRMSLKSYIQRADARGPKTGQDRTGQGRTRQGRWDKVCWIRVEKDKSWGCIRVKARADSRLGLGLS